MTWGVLLGPVLKEHGQALMLIFNNRTIPEILKNGTRAEDVRRTASNKILFFIPFLVFFNKDWLKRTDYYIVREHTWLN
jgi:hypothetical protein